MQATAVIGLAEVKGLAAAAAELAVRFDPDSVPLPDADALDDELARMHKLIGGMRTRFARRVEDSHAWHRKGARSPEEHLAKKSGTSPAREGQKLKASRRLPDQPATEEAVRRGELSPEQTELISDAVDHNPGAERELVEKAGKQSLPELRESCEQKKAEGDRDGAARRERIRRERFARKLKNTDGSGEIRIRSTLDVIAKMWAAAMGYANEAFREARAEGRHETAEAYMADGFERMADAAARIAQGGAPDESKPARSPVPATIIVRIDWDSLLRGYPIEGETCEIAGVGAVPVEVVWEMIHGGDAFLAAVVTKGDDVVNVAHLGRRPTAHQRTALLWRDPTCQAEGCGRAVSVQTDHRVDWADTKITWLAWLDRLCKHHHDQKTRHDWRLVPGKGKRPFVPPDDPRHPKHHAHAPPSGAPPPTPDNPAA